MNPAEVRNSLSRAKAASCCSTLAASTVEDAPVATRRAVVIFTGDPRREERLKNLPCCFLSTLHEHLIRTVRESSDAFLVLASDAGSELELTGLHGCVTVPGASLAEKLDATIRHLFEEFTEVVVLAGDVAGLTGEILARAFDTLDRVEGSMVVGPSDDGGFYLVGFNRPPGMDWSAIRWYSQRTCMELVVEGIRSGLSPVLLPTIRDIDSRHDATAVARSLPVSLRALRSRLLSLLATNQPALTSSSRFIPAAYRSLSGLRAPPLV